jgi:hypothetical protein
MNEQANLQQTHQNTQNLDKIGRGCPQRKIDKFEYREIYLCHFCSANKSEHLLAAK